MKRQRVVFEGLEARLLLASHSGEALGDWHNESNARDVDGDGYVLPKDVLRLINLVDLRGSGTIDQIQQTWRAEEAEASELYGGFHPDVDGNGWVTPQDILQTINQIANRSAESTDTVAVIPDADGTPTRFVFTAIDGREHSIDVSGQGFRVVWSDDAFSALSADERLTIAMRPGVGVMELTSDDVDGQALVTRFESGGVATTERYVCGPIVGWGDGELIVFPPNIELPEIDIRRPIEGFEEFLGAIVMERMDFDDGAFVVKNYEEGVLERLLSVQAGLDGGTLVTVETRDVGELVTEPASPNDPFSAPRLRLERQLLELVRNGYANSESLSPQQIDEAWIEAFGQ
ncbi:MAG: hypothetical protein AAFU85_07030 [Planctomycetota bacterium]